jgi:hypothetical protein
MTSLAHLRKPAFRGRLTARSGRQPIVASEAIGVIRGWTSLYRFGGSALN